jgi:hypothetical protein
MTVPSTRHPFSSAAASVADPVTSTLSIGQALAKLAEKRPEMDVVRYHHKNVKWSFKHVEFFSDCLATGFLDMGLAPGDVVLSWLPSHFSEQVSMGTRDILNFILLFSDEGVFANVFFLVGVFVCSTSCNSHVPKQV